MPEVGTQTDIRDVYDSLPKHHRAYIDRATEIKRNTQNRMGYPVTGPLYGQFTAQGFLRERNQKNKLIDTRILGIEKESVADTLMLNIGGQLQVWEKDSARKPERSGAWQAEIEILYMFADYFNFSRELIRGYVTSGGTEGNLAGLWWAREYLINKSKEKNNQSKQNPILYISDQAHYSILKIANILNLEYQLIQTDQNGCIDADFFSAAVDQLMKQDPVRPLIICATVGTTQLGGIDPIPEMKMILEKKVGNRGGLYSIHIDGALLGAVLPVIKPFGEINSIFDYADSIAISGHKFLGTTLICGVVLTKKSILESSYLHKDISVNYVGGIQDTTVSGSRSGLLVFEMHNAMHELDLHGNLKRLKKLVNQCLENAKYLAYELGLLVGKENVIHNSKQFVVVFPAPLSKIANDDLVNHYGLMTVDGNRLGVCTLAPVDTLLIERFLNDYKKATQNGQSIVLKNEKLNRSIQCSDIQNRRRCRL